MAKSIGVFLEGIKIWDFEEKKKKKKEEWVFPSTYFISFHLNS